MLIQSWFIGAVVCLVWFMFDWLNRQDQTTDWLDMTVTGVMVFIWPIWFPLWVLLRIGCILFPGFDRRGK